MDEALRHALQVCVLLSPTGTEQEAFSNMVNAMARDGVSPQNQILNLMGALTDGLKYGNWPS
jgi:hypothetical protein